MYFLPPYFVLKYPFRLNILYWNILRFFSALRKKHAGRLGACVQARAHPHSKHGRVRPASSGCPAPGRLLPKAEGTVLSKKKKRLFEFCPKETKFMKKNRIVCFLWNISSQSDFYFFGPMSRLVSSLAHLPAEKSGQGHPETAEQLWLLLAQLAGGPIFAEENRPPRLCLGGIADGTDLLRFTSFPVEV